MSIDTEGRTNSERAIKIEAWISRPQHLFNQTREHLRHTLTAVLRVTGQSQPAALTQFLIGNFIGLWRGDFAIVPLTTFFVPGLVAGRNDLAA